jgi:beta-lactamase regulating signal transducer with metallopeptidase domain
MSQSTVVSLAWALVHSFWQGAVIGLVAGVVGAALGGARPAARYLMYCFALVAMLAVPIATFALIRAMPAGGVGAAPARAFAAAVAPPVPTLDGAPPGRAGVESARLVWLVRIWLAGVVVLGLRSFLGWAWAQRLKTFKASPASEPLRQVAALLRNRLGLKRAVRIVMSAAAEVPATLGWLRPIVLIPVAAVTALSPEQIELLIAHELAHVRRHDYLVNLVQTAIETLLFYHPAVWWLNARIRMEREHCCDDLAVSACGNVGA